MVTAVVHEAQHGTCYLACDCYLAASWTVTAVLTCRSLPDSPTAAASHRNEAGDGPTRKRLTQPVARAASKATEKVSGVFGICNPFCDSE